MRGDVNAYIKSHRINLWLELIFHTLVFRSLNVITSRAISGQDTTEQFQLCQQHFTEYFTAIIKITDFYKVFNSQSAAKVIKEECCEASIIISSYDKR